MRSFVGVFTLMVIAKGDIVTMKNGDRITGTIVKKDGATLTVKSAEFGMVTAPWARVASIATDNPVTVVMKDKATVEGKVAPAGEQLSISGKTVPPQEVATLRNADEQKLYLRMNHPRLTDLWGMAGNFGVAGAAGNARTMTINVPLTFTRVTANDRITAHFQFLESNAKLSGALAETAKAIRGGWTYNRNLDHSKLFATVTNEYEYDRFQNLNLRSVAGGGLGWHARKVERGFLDLVSGFDYNHESFFSENRQRGEFYWGDTATMKWSKRITLTQSYRMFQGVVASSGIARQNADVTWSAMLTKYFTWNATLSDRFLNDPPAGVRKNDFLYSTGIGIKFAR